MYCEMAVPVYSVSCTESIRFQPPFNTSLYLFSKKSYLMGFSLIVFL